MKSFALLALTLLSPALARAERRSPAAAAAPAPAADKGALLGEIDALRRRWLPTVLPPDPLTVRFLPRLQDIRSGVESAPDAAALKRSRREFADFKKVLLRRAWSDAVAAGHTKDSFAAFSAEAAREAATEASVRSELEQMAARTRMLAMSSSFQARAGGDGARFFDASAVRAGSVAGPGLTLNSAGVAPIAASPAAASGDRYEQVRRVMRARGCSRRVVDAAIQEAERQHADPLLVLSVVNAESACDAHARSSVGAVGLMQLMPGTARDLGVRRTSALTDIQTNLRAGIRYLKSLWGQFVGGDMLSLQSMNPFSSHDVKAAVAAYNAGPGAVRRYDGVPPYRETQGYVKTVLGFYAKLQQSLGW